MLKAILIDNEKHCLERTAYLLEQYCSTSVQVLGQYQEMEEAIIAIHTLKPDVIFLDVELNDNKTGFDLLGGVKQIDFDIIFVTGHKEYAYDAFDIDAIAYLRKPFDGDRLMKAVAKVRTRPRMESLEVQPSLQKSVSQDGIVKIGIPTNKNGEIHIDFINKKEIVYCKSEGNYTQIFGLKINGRETLLGTACKPLKTVSEFLDNQGFFQIHEAYLINLDFIKTYINGRGGKVVMLDKVILNVAAERKSEFKRRLEKAGLVKLV